MRTLEFQNLEPQSSKKVARALVAIDIFHQASISIEKYRKLRHAPNDRTPLEVLNRLVSLHCGPKSLEINSGKPCTTTTPSIPFVARLKTNTSTYETNHPYRKDHKYCKNKLALRIMGQWAFENEDVQTKYSQLHKQTPFYRGRPFENEEGRIVEFKGAKDSAQPVKESSIDTKVTARTICAFLNTNGGRLYWGIHDKSHIIQGVQLDSPDKTTLTLTSSLKDNLQGVSLLKYVQIHIHPVVSFIPRFPSPERPKEVDEYTKSLEDEVAYWREYFKKSSNPLQSSVFLIEIIVKRHPTVVVCGNVAYERIENANHTLKFGDLKTRIIREHLQ